MLKAMDAKQELTRGNVARAYRFLALSMKPEEAAERIERLPSEFQETAAINYADMRKFLGKPAYL